LKSRFSQTAILSILILAAAIADATPNRVLQLDGHGDWVQLPDDVFNGLDEATVEAWVKWDRLGYFSQPFGFGSAEQWGKMIVNNRDNFSHLQFFIYADARSHVITVDDILSEGRWYHIAAVSGAGGMKLYLNGVLVGQRDYTGSFSSLGRGEQNGFGAPHWAVNDHFEGQLDEIAVWRVARTGAEIRASMSRPLTASDPDLFGFWNFDAGDARDSSPNRLHGALTGDAQLVSAELPTPDQLARPAVVFGLVTDAAGAPLPSATVQLKANGTAICQSSTDASGIYRMVFFPSVQTYDLSAARGELGTWRMSVPIHGGEHRDIPLVLRPAASISGAVVAWDNALLSGVSVQAVRIAGSTDSLRVVATTLSDEGGQYRFTNLEPGRYLVRCYTLGDYVYHAGESPLPASPPALSLPGKALNVAPGKPLGDVDLRLSPVKKGVWQTYTHLKGLASNEVHAIHRDADGLLWFGTAGGVSRYDGEHFASLEGLAPQLVNALHRDAGGTLWIATDGGGVCRYDGEDFITLAAREGLGDGHVQCIAEEPSGALWFGTSGGGASRYDGENLATFTTEDGLGHGHVRNIGIAPDGAVWFATYHGLSRYYGESFVTLTAQDGLPHNQIRTVDWDAEGVLWVGTDGGGIARYDGEEFITYSTQDGLAHNRVAAAHIDPDGVLWIGTFGGGVSRYDGKGFITFTVQDGLAHNQIRSILSDPDGVLWFGTYGGVSRYDGSGFITSTTQDGLADDAVYAIHRSPDGLLWFGTDRGITRYDNRTPVSITAADGLSGDRIRDIHQTAAGVFWFATSGGGLSRYDGRSFLNFSREHGLQSDVIIDLHGAGDGGLWIGSWTNAQKVRFANTPTGSSGSPAGGPQLAVQTVTPRGEDQQWYVTAIHRDADGVVWFATYKYGLYRYHQETFTDFTTEDGLPSNQIHAVHRGYDGTLWLGTENGICRYDGRDFLSLSRVTGSDRILTIHESPDSTLWFGTLSGGVIGYDGGAWSWLDTRDGLADNTVRSIGGDEEGSLYFGTDRGVTRHRRTVSTPSVRIVSVQTRHGEAGPGHVPPVTAGYPVTIRYQAVDFKTHPEKRQYRHRVLRLDDEGHPVGGTDSPYHVGGTPYSRWTPREVGSYRFEVQAIDRDLRYSAPAATSLTVVPPLHLDPWIAVPSAGGILLLLTGAIGFGMRYYSQRQESRQLREQMLVQE